jgi:hypothetical protein
MGQPFVPLLGLQCDEELIVSGFLPPHTIDWAYLGHSGIPIVWREYIGALKCWIYHPIFAVFGTGVWSQREPVLLAGAASIWLFFLLLRRIAGKRAAVVGTGLLAVDSLYLLTTCYDCGPVALQHLLLVGGMLLLLRFYQEGGMAPLAGGFFLFGLAMWDKAVAACMLGAMGVAALLVFWGPLWRMITARRAAVAILALTLGVLPLVVYNVDTHFSTFRDQVKYSTTGVRGVLEKSHVLVKTMLGSAFFGGQTGGLLEEDWQNPQPAAPRSALEKASSIISDMAGRPRVSLLLPAFALALALAAWTRGVELRAIVFCLVTMAVQWIQMALTWRLGRNVYHTILLWPLPQLVIGVAFASASRRLGRGSIRALACALAVLMCAGALQINEYYRMAWRNGGEVYWTNAIYRLADYMKGVSAERVYSTGTGIVEPLRVLYHGSLPMDLLDIGPPFAPRIWVLANDFYVENIDPKDHESPSMKLVMAAVSRPDHVFLGHTKAWELAAQEDGSAELVKLAGDAGYRQETMATVPDSFGRAVFEVFHFVRK